MQDIISIVSQMRKLRQGDVGKPAQDRTAGEGLGLSDLEAPRLSIPLTLGGLAVSEGRGQSW